jgi:hypothetical protein
MATSITWTDTAPRTLTNSKPTPADRFDNWRSITPHSASAAVGLGTGTTHVWEFRQDYGAEFALSKIPTEDQDMVMRLLRHLQIGGQVTVNTGDSAGRSYTCIRFPGWEVPDGAEMTDNRMLEYTLTLKLKNVAPADMLCNYGQEPIS